MVNKTTNPKPIVKVTCAANRKDRRASQSRSISNSNSWRSAGLRTQLRAAVRCSERMTSTVLLKGGGEPLAGVMENNPKGESEDLLLHRLGVPPRNGVKVPKGVFDPGVSARPRDG